MAAITLESVSKTYPKGKPAVSGLNLTIEDGEFMVVVGPSGCGKTTVLRMIAGLEEVTSGTIRIGDRNVNNLPPRSRDIAMVFQNYALYPHMTVRDNISFGLRQRKMDNLDVLRRVDSAAHLLGLAEVLDRKPAQLSGGQRQRVAMGRAIVREPAAFLMDEPLSNLDAKLRVQMRAEVSRLQRRLGVATVYVTHDQTEAMTMGDRVAVMRDGILQQCDRPQVLYDQPANLFVAGFIGSPAMNIFEVDITVAPDGRSAEVGLGHERLRFSGEDLDRRPEFRSHDKRRLAMGIRPEHLRLTSEISGPSIGGQVDVIEALGSELLVHFRADVSPRRPDGGDTTTGRANLNTAGVDIRDCVARVPPHAKVVVNTMVRFEVNLSQALLFDLETGHLVGSPPLGVSTASSGRALRPSP